jgi:hypothetical protein
MAYAQARIQSRYGKRADADVWLKLQNIHDLGSYLQTAQQTPLRHWVLGISATHSSHEIELTLRQKYRLHVDEVVNWVPASWRKPLCWIKRLAELPILQYLAAGNKPLDWMVLDVDLGNFTSDDPAARLQAMREAGCSALVEAWLRDGYMLEGWIREWNRVRPKSKITDTGFTHLEKQIHQLIHTQLHQQSDILLTDYENAFNTFRRLFRRYAFQPAGVCAYLAIVAIDLHRIRGDLMQRLHFPDNQNLAEGLVI